MNNKAPDLDQFPTQFLFTYGCWEESQQLGWQDGKLVYRPSVWSAGDQVVSVEATVEEWNEFWAVAEAVNLWQW